MRAFPYWFVVVMLLTISVPLEGCSKKDPNRTGNSQGAPSPAGQQQNEGDKKRITEGRIQPISKQECVREVTGHILLSKPTGQDISEGIKKAINSALGAQENRPVLWVRLNVNVNELIELLREQDSTAEGFKKEDFLGLAGKVKLAPIAPNGVVEVDGLSRFLQQDLIFQLPKDARGIEVVIGQVSLAKFPLSRHDKQKEDSNELSSGIADPSARSKSGVSAKDTKATLQNKLAQVGVKVQCKDDDALLITEGFPYQKNLTGNYKIEIVKVEKGLFTASESSTVPTSMMGMVYGVADGSFIAQCNAEEGAQTLADAIGNIWVFTEPGMSFNVYLRGSKKPAYTVKSRIKGATISFTKEGVLLKDFEFTVYFNAATLKVQCNTSKAEVYAVDATKITKHPDKGFPKDWGNLFYPWLLPSVRNQHLIAGTPLQRSLPPRSYLVAICIRVDQKDPVFGLIEVGHGAFWAEEDKDFDYFAETLGLRISKNGQRFTPKVLADKQDPFKPDEYVGIYVHHLGTEMLYFRIYRADLRPSEVTRLTCKLERKTEEDFLESKPTGAKGVFRGFTAEVPIYQ